MTDRAAVDPAWQVLIRSVSKTGEFFLAQDEFYRLSRTLSAQDVVALYVAIRDHSGRIEEEWRDEFVDAFRAYEHLLPTPLV